MRASRLCSTVLLLVTVFVACSPPQAQSSLASPENAIREARLAQNAAIAARNADSVAAFWTEDVSVTSGLGFVLRGREAYKSAFGHDAPMLYSRLPEKIAVSTKWPLAWEEGTWTGTTTTGQPVQSLRGRYSAQWVNQNGRWQIRSELFVALHCSGPACDFPLRLR